MCEGDGVRGNRAIWAMCLLMAAAMWSTALASYVFEISSPFVIFYAASGCMGFVAWGIVELMEWRQQRRLQGWITQRPAWEAGGSDA